MCPPLPLEIISLLLHLLKGDPYLWHSHRVIFLVLLKDLFPILNLSTRSRVFANLGSASLDIPLLNRSLPHGLFALPNCDRGPESNPGFPAVLLGYWPWPFILQAHGLGHARGSTIEKPFLGASGASTIRAGRFVGSGGFVSSQSKCERVVISAPRSCRTASGL